MNAPPEPEILVDEPKPSQADALPADRPIRLGPNSTAADILNYVTRRTAQGKGTLIKHPDGTAEFFGHNRRARRANAARGTGKRRGQR